MDQVAIHKTKNRRKKNDNFFNPFILLLNHIAAMALLISYLSPYVSPENFWFLAFFGLAYPYLVILNLLFVIYWILRFKRIAFYSLVILLGGWNQINNHIQFNNSNPPFEKDEHAIKVMSYNVKLFDLYNWSQNLQTKSKMFDLIKREEPNILCIQEFYTSDNTNQFNNLDTIIQFQKSKNFHTEYTTTLRDIDHWGIAIFSSYPIIKNGKIIFSRNSNNICIYSDLLIEKDTVRVYNVHLQSIKFDPHDYEFMDNFMKQGETEEIAKSKNIIKRLKTAYIKRSVQSNIVSKHIEASPYPVIVCGDFNDVPSSYTYQTISNNLKDAFVESGNGLGRSYTRKFPSVRIDFILHSDCYMASNFRTIQEELSDHYPIVSLLRKKKN